MKVALHNLGCKVNAYETEVMTQNFADSGYEIVGFTEKADIYVVNTCSVTNIADRKSRQMLHKAKKNNENAIVVATGCYVQVAAQTLKEDRAVDLVVGNNKKKDIVNIVEQFLKDRSLNEIVDDLGKNCQYEEMSLTTVTDHTRAYIKIQDGCNMFCTYCIIPYARGNVRSRKPENVVEEVKSLVERGYREVILTGIHLSSYLSDDVRLIDLVEMLDKIPGLDRIRLGSLEPGIVTQSFAKRLSACSKVCPHFHLSMQSGCNQVLKRMNRHYNSELYYERCQILREYYDDPAITTDVIVGFPGETENEFTITKKFIEKVGFAEIHVFKYSKRAGTPAATMEGQVDDQIKNQRSEALIELGDKLTADYRLRRKGKTDEVLFEEVVSIDGTQYQVGHTPEYIKVALPLEKNYCGKIKEIMIQDSLNKEIVLASESKLY